MTECNVVGFVTGAAVSGGTGGGSNFLCMHPSPEYNKFDMRNDSLAFSWVSLTY